VHARRKEIDRVGPRLLAAQPIADGDGAQESALARRRRRRDGDDRNLDQPMTAQVVRRPFGIGRPDLAFLPSFDRPSRSDDAFVTARAPSRDRRVEVALVEPTLDDERARALPSAP